MSVVVLYDCERFTFLIARLRKIIFQLNKYFVLYIEMIENVFSNNVVVNLS